MNSDLLPRQAQTTHLRPDLHGQQALDHSSHGHGHIYHHQDDSLPSIESQNRITARNMQTTYTSSVPIQLPITAYGDVRSHSQVQGSQLSTRRMHIDESQTAGNRENAPSPERIIDAPAVSTSVVRNNQQQTLITRPIVARGRGGRGGRGSMRGRPAFGGSKCLLDLVQTHGSKEATTKTQLPSAVSDASSSSTAKKHKGIGGKAKRGGKDGATRQHSSLGIAEAPTHRDPGHPELPDPPCSILNQQVWPFDFQKLHTHRTGQVRPMVWPYTCHAKLSDGKICGKPHPTKIHAEHKKFMEIWLPKHLDSAEEIGTWRLSTGCPIEVLDDHLKKFVSEVSDASLYQPFHISFYSPDYFNSPARELGWPEPLPGSQRLTVGYFKRSSNPLVMNRWFQNWCKESAKEIESGFGLEDEK